MSAIVVVRKNEGATEAIKKGKRRMGVRFINTAHFLCVPDSFEQGQNDVAQHDFIQNSEICCAGLDLLILHTCAQ